MHKKRRCISKESFITTITGGDPTISTHDNITTIINEFKLNITKKIHDMGLKSFKLQSGYFGFLILNKQSLDQITSYLIQNPENWRADSNNPKNWEKITNEDNCCHEEEYCNTDT